MSRAREHDAREEHWCWCCRLKVNCSVDPDSKELVCSQCENTFVEIYDPLNEEQRPESFIPPTIPSPLISPASPSASAAAAATNPSPASTLYASSIFNMLPPASLSTPVQVRRFPLTPAGAAPVTPPLGATASAGAAGTRSPPAHSRIAGNLHSVLQHIIRSLHGRAGINPVGDLGAGMSAGSENIHGNIGDYAFGNLQNIMNELMERNPLTHGPNPAPPEVIKALPRIKVDSEDAGSEGCSVCQDDFIVGNTLILLPCGHKFHDECIKPWIEKNNSCPVCRKELTSRSSSAASQSGSAGAAGASASE